MKLVAMIMAGVISLTSVTSALANTEMYTVMIKFNDGVTRQYNKVPADTPIEVLAGRIQKDFPNKSLTDIVEANTWAHIPQQAATPMPIPTEAPKDGVNWGKVAWVVGGALLIVLVGGAIAKSGGSAGGCANTWDTAKDGSRCGNRAASVRPGGK
jgi:hypothetical protein